MCLPLGSNELRAVTSRPASKPAEAASSPAGCAPCCPACYLLIRFVGSRYYPPPVIDTIYPATLPRYGSFPAWVQLQSGLSAILNTTVRRREDALVWRWLARDTAHATCAPLH